MSTARWNPILVVLGVVLATLTGIWFVEPFSPAARAERQVRRIIEGARPTYGALYDFPYSPRDVELVRVGASRAMARAALSARLVEEARRRHRLQATIALAQGRFSTAASLLEGLHFEYPNDPGISNDLGVAYLELAATDAALLLEAMPAFLRAFELAPDSPQVAYNVALTYAKLHLPDEAARWADGNLGSENARAWSIDITDILSLAPGADRSGNSLEAYADRASWEETVRDPTQWWTSLISALRDPHPIEWSPALGQLVTRHEDYFGDRSPLAIVEPLTSANVDEMISLRKAMAVAESEQNASPVRAVEILDSVATQVSRLAAYDFDRLRWTILRSENALRSGDRAQLARLQEAVAAARDARFIWLYGHGLESLSGTLGAATQLTLVERNQLAIDTLVSIGASYDAMRSRSNLAVLAFLEGDWVASLKMSLETMTLTPESDHLRWANVLDVLIQNPLLPEPVRLAYVEPLLDHASHLPKANFASALALAARIHASRRDFDMAERYISELRRLEAPDEPYSPRYLHLGMAEARLHRERDTVAESLAFFEEATTDLARRGVFTHPIYLEWADLLRQRGDREAAEHALDAALEGVERLNDQIGRLHFDPIRRSVYETAIDFYLEADDDTAWEMVQRYRTKLDTTILPLFGQAATDIHAPVQIPDLDDRTILEYTVLDDRLLIWVIADGALRYQKVPLDRDDLTEEVQRYLHFIARPDVTSSSLPELGDSLYEKLIDPVRDWLDPAKPLVIIPDRILHRLPFAALPAPDGRFLVEDFVIAQSPTLVRALHDAPTWSETPRLLAAGPQYPSIEMTRELGALEGFYPSIRVMDSQTTRDGFLEQSHGASMLHVTGHSAVDGASGLTSTILLDGVNGPNRITAADVAGLQLDSGSLVVLASCDSSVGNAIGGIGVRGLTSAFLAAGAGAVAGSLWPVDDAATGELMTSFHRSLIEGETVAGALRRAQLDFIEDGRHPYEWGAFTVTGDQTVLRPIPAHGSAEATEAAAVFP